LVVAVPSWPTQRRASVPCQSPNFQFSTVFELKSQLPQVGVLAPQARLAPSHVHWLLAHAPVVPTYVLQLRQVGPQWVASVLL
jgi:hypothetical protein